MNELLCAWELKRRRLVKTVVHRDLAPALLKRREIGFTLTCALHDWRRAGRPRLTTGLLNSEAVHLECEVPPDVAAAVGFLPKRLGKPDITPLMRPFLEKRIFIKR
jgi:hypothetical protein